MRFQLCLLVALALFASMPEGMAQRSGMPGKARKSYSVPRVRGAKARIICPVFDRGRYPYHGFGFKLGDPFALTYKYYPARNIGFSADIGRVASGLYRDYYRALLGPYRAEEGDAVATYVGHHVKSDWVVDIRLLFQTGVSRRLEGLQVYAGGGWAWKRTHLHYDYRYAEVAPGADPFGSLQRQRTPAGPQVVAGLEYSYFSIPVSAFLECEYFVDVAADPGYRRIKGGIGLRYIF